MQLSEGAGTRKAFAAGGALYNAALILMEIHVTTFILGRRFLASVAVLLPLASLAAAQAQTNGSPDVTLDSAQRIIALAVDDNAVDGRTVRVALRSLKDPTLAPLFEALAKSSDPGTRLDASVALVMATKEPKWLSVSAMMETKDDARIGAVIAMLIDAEVLTTPQLEEIVKATGVDPAHAVMAASELLRRKALPDHAILLKQLDRTSDGAGRYDMVRHYSAITLLENKNDAENAAALKSLKEMAATHVARLEPVQELMLLRVFKDKLTLALPWVQSLAQDAKCTPRLRQTAIATLLSLHDPLGGDALKDLIDARKDVGDQLSFGLTAIEFADQLKPAQISGLGLSTGGQALGSPLLKAVSDLARKAVAGEDITSGLMTLVKQGQPIVANWALGYASSAPAARKLAIRVAIIEQASIVDDVRGADLERAAIAAHRVVDDCGDEGRKELGRMLKDTNRAAAEAILAGMYRANATNLSPLVTPIWEDLQKSAASEIAANYAALLLAREGSKEPLKWLAGMIQGGTVQNIGFRAMAGWQYAKLKDQGPALIGRIVAGMGKKEASK